MIQAPRIRLSCGLCQCRMNRFEIEHSVWVKTPFVKESQFCSVLYFENEVDKHELVQSGYLEPPHEKLCRKRDILAWREF